MRYLNHMNLTMIGHGCKGQIRHRQAVYWEVDKEEVGGQVHQYNQIGGSAWSGARGRHNAVITTPETSATLWRLRRRKVSDVSYTGMVCIGITSVAESPIVLLDSIEGGELFERVIDDDFVLTEKAVTIFMRQICEGVEYIHSQNILHLDMKVGFRSPSDHIENSDGFSLGSKGRSVSKIWERISAKIGLEGKGGRRMCSTVLAFMAFTCARL